MPKPKVAVVGGGVAGLAAAMTLSQANLDVTVFEASHQLGGRARGIQYQGLSLDNGQHILLGAYHQTLRLLKLSDAAITSHIQRMPLMLSVFNLKLRNYFQLKAPTGLPAPLHMLAGLLTAKGLTHHDKWRAFRMMLWLKWHRFQLTQDSDLATFLSHQHQTDTLTQYLWEPLCLAALNTPLRLASAQVFLNVLRDSFNKQRQDADVLLAKTDLTTLISVPWANFVVKHGGQVRTGTTVKSVQPSDKGYLLNIQGEDAEFSHVIIATGPHQLATIAETLPLLTKHTEHLRYQPITTVYLQYMHMIRLPQPMLGMVNCTSQWVFDRGQICGQNGLLAVVISAHEDIQFNHTSLAAQIHEELCQLIPQLEKPLWHKVITEKRATFECSADIIRPDNLTHYPNLYLAGDYTVGDYPATIEGAVRSGIAAANLALADAEVYRNTCKA